MRDGAHSHHLAMHFEVCAARPRNVTCRQISQPYAFSLTTVMDELWGDARRDNQSADH